MIDFGLLIGILRQWNADAFMNGLKSFITWLPAKAKENRSFEQFKRDADLYGDSAPS